MQTTNQTLLPSPQEDEKRGVHCIFFHCFLLVVNWFLYRTIVARSFFGSIGCTVFTSRLQPKPATDTKTAFSTSPIGRRRVKGCFPTSSISKK
jgi:hypothetical protein